MIEIKLTGARQELALGAPPPWRPLPDPPNGKRQTNHKEGSSMSAKSAHPNIIYVSYLRKAM